MIWDLDIHLQLPQAQQPFALDVTVQSAAKILVLCGPSGAGKTLALHAIAGLRKPDAGRVCIAGKVLFDSALDHDLLPQQRELGVVFQDYALFPHLTVRQNIAFGLQRGWRNPSLRKLHQRVAHWCASFGLETVQDHFPQQLSGGQRQRTALARALVAEPRALLLDEPFAALDRPLRERLRDELLALQQQLQLPLLLITHDEDDVRSAGGDVVHLAGGRVQPTERAHG